MAAATTGPENRAASAAATADSATISSSLPAGPNADAGVIYSTGHLYAFENDDQAATAPVAAARTAKKSLFTRWAGAYLADWNGNSPSGNPTTSKRRGDPPPIASPPFPATDWPIGGTPLIGAPDTQTYVLQQAINENRGHNKIYGWFDFGGNASTNNRGNDQAGAANVPANSPAAYEAYPNTIVLDQFALYTEKIEDSAQKEHFDWGYRLTALYGQDYRYTTAKGMLSQQLLVKNAQYGFDPVMAYVDFYLPHIADGTIVRIGRYVSLPDIEAQLAPNNYTYTHSILYTYDCYTQTGVNVTIKLNDHWTVQAGLSPGCDVMPWTTDAKVTGNACFTYTWSHGGDALNTCDNTINDGEYAYNNLTAFYETWYHKINETWHTDTEFWYQYMKDTPNMFWYDSGQGSPASKTMPWPEVTGGGMNENFGAVCQDPRLPQAQQRARCYAPEWAITNYIEHSFWKNQASLNIRNEWVDDIKGQRTGTPGKYEESMVGLDLWLGSTVTFRPELSYMHSFNSFGEKGLDISPGSAVANAVLYNLNPAGGPHQAYAYTGKDQMLVLAADLIWHF